MAFRLECVSELYKNLGKYDAIVEFTELAIRDFIKESEIKKNFKEFIQEKSEELEIKVDSVDEDIFRSRISQSYILSVYQNAELFIHKFKDECNDLKNTNWKLDNTNDSILIKTIRKITSINKGKEQIGEYRIKVFDYYRIIRNKYSHDLIQDTKVEKAFEEVMKFNGEIKKFYPKLSAPNEFENISFDDFLLFTSVIKDIAYSLSNIIEPNNEEFKNYYLRKDYFKELNQNPERKENALIGHLLATFGIEKVQAKEIIKLMHH